MYSFFFFVSLQNLNNIWNQFHVLECKQGLWLWDTSMVIDMVVVIAYVCGYGLWLWHMFVVMVYGYGICLW